MSQEVLRPAPLQNATPMSLTLPVPSDGREAQVANVRESLLKHIQSVQREIARLQERQKIPKLSQKESEDEAATRLQHWWRSRRKPGLSGPPKRASRRSRWRPVHFAAARIQRCFRIYRWRRRFVDVSIRQIGWLGSLSWLQEQNLLYGTELADKEDVRWWSEQRATAPLDREVDPWGALKLREHLDKMWYGLSENLAKEEEELLLLHHHQKQLLRSQSTWQGQQPQQSQQPQPQQPQQPPQPKNPPQQQQPKQKPQPKQLQQPQQQQQHQHLQQQKQHLQQKHTGWITASHSNLREWPAVKITQKLSATVKNVKSSPRYDLPAKGVMLRNYSRPVGFSAAAPVMARSKSPCRPQSSWAPTLLPSSRMSPPGQERRRGKEA